ncbi:class I SAM-dependent methyltransferase [Ralstonia sp. 25C]|uniref:class I SAM-dependent methyltransferase n=1 Tax=Ralstonia sp. 25C TaxID=3447363 RepID=UPI003F74E1F9
MRDFTYVSGFTGYMQEILRFVQDHLSEQPRKALDIPAGSGVFARQIEQLGHEVTRADIHGKDGFVYANMEGRLPFGDAAFDLVTCMEGIEHVISPTELMRELARITRQDGHIVISTPNVINFRSRLQFLFTGTFYQFGPDGVRQTHGRPVDRGHISSLTPLQLSYIMGCFGAELVEIRTDRAKKKILIPLYLLLKPIAYAWTWAVSRRTAKGTYPGVRNPVRLLTGFRLAFGRSQILIFKKIAEVAST